MLLATIGSCVLTVVATCFVSPRERYDGYHLHAGWHFGLRVAIHELVPRSTIDIRSAAARIGVTEALDPGILDIPHDERKRRDARMVRDQPWVGREHAMKWIMQNLGERSASAFRLAIALGDRDTRRIESLRESLSIPESWITKSTDPTEIIRTLESVERQLLFRSGNDHEPQLWTPNTDAGPLKDSSIESALLDALGETITLRLAARPLGLARCPLVLIDAQHREGIGDPVAGQRQVTVNDLQPEHKSADYELPRTDLLAVNGQLEWTRSRDEEFERLVNERNRKRRMGGGFGRMANDRIRLTEVSRWYQTFLVPEKRRTVRVPTTDGRQIRVGFTNHGRTFDELHIGGDHEDLARMIRILREPGSTLRLSCHVDSVHRQPAGGDFDIVVNVTPTNIELQPR